MLGKKLGELGEKLASQYLQAKGYQILGHNFSSRFGEIDLIAFEGGELVFVEVKTRSTKNFGLPQEAVSTRKIQHLQRAGYYYLRLHPELPRSLRIDVVAINFSPDGGHERVVLLKNVTSA